MKPCNLKVFLLCSSIGLTAGAAMDPKDLYEMVGGDQTNHQVFSIFQGLCGKNTELLKVDALSTADQLLRDAEGLVAAHETPYLSPTVPAAAASRYRDGVDTELMGMIDTLFNLDKETLLGELTWKGHLHMSKDFDLDTINALAQTIDQAIKNELKTIFRGVINDYNKAIAISVAEAPPPAPYPLASAFAEPSRAAYPPYAGVYGAGVPVAAEGPGPVVNASGGLTLPPVPIMRAPDLSVDESHSAALRKCADLTSFVAALEKLDKEGQLKHLSIKEGMKTLFGQEGMKTLFGQEIMDTVNRIIAKRKTLEDLKEGIELLRSTSMPAAAAAARSTARPAAAAARSTATLAGTTPEESNKLRIDAITRRHQEAGTKKLSIMAEIMTPITLNEGNVTKIAQMIRPAALTQESIFSAFSLALESDTKKGSNFSHALTQQLSGKDASDISGILMVCDDISDKALKALKS